MTSFTVPSKRARASSRPVSGSSFRSRCGPSSDHSAPSPYVILPLPSYGMCSPELPLPGTTLAIWPSRGQNSDPSPAASPVDGAFAGRKRSTRPLAVEMRASSGPPSCAAQT